MLLLLLSFRYPISRNHGFVFIWASDLGPTHKVNLWCCCCYCKPLTMVSSFYHGPVNPILYPFLSLVLMGDEVKISNIILWLILTNGLKLLVSHKFYKKSNGYGVIQISTAKIHRYILSSLHLGFLSFMVALDLRGWNPDRIPIDQRHQRVSTRAPQSQKTSYDVEANWAGPRINLRLLS